MAPALRTTIKPPPRIKVSKAKDEDLDGNKEVLGPLLKENGNGRDTTEQEHNKEDNYSIASSTLTTSNKDRNKENNRFSALSALTTPNKDYNKEDKHFITLSALTASNKDYNNISNIKDNSD